ncbi:hypothetical protein M422DRAFT_263112 [Sphaerobolus stellatus SS14]|uniref:Uncharacterized protein n=1 Tax=Sphaerobolus stellatus (strain SS14) TaxID=990650 RepID=A0A0C9UIR1_SPHS4|nr:hypothetical protein M422DRAFT_263112 [Sphaerobolus stellatus SS14]
MSSLSSNRSDCVLPSSRLILLTSMDCCCWENLRLRRQRRDIISSPTAEAHKHIERAAYLGFAPAHYKLGHAYEYAVPPFPFDPLLPVQYYLEDIDRNCNWGLIFTQPWTKVKSDGEDIYCSKHDGPADPIAALITHLRINNPPTLLSFPGNTTTG